jgi:UDP-N-acetylglucosamine 3-dehydrogenase
VDWSSKNGDVVAGVSFVGKLKLGLIGLGYIGKTHLENCLRLEDADLLAVADLSRRALKRAKELGVPNTYQDYSKLLDNREVDAVIIALPTHLHVACVRAAAEANKHILLEKPLAKSVAEGREIVSVTGSKGVKLMIGYPLRFAQPFLAVKESIDEGRLGEVQTAYAVNISTGPFMHRAETGVPSPVPDWWWKKELTGGGALMDLGSHMIDLARWYFGEASEVKSYLGYRFGLEQEDHAVSLVKFENGPIVTINVGWYSQQSQTKMDVHGTGGHSTACYVQPSKIKTAVQLLLRRTTDFYLPFLNEMRHFVESVKRDVQPEPSGEEGLKDLEVIEKAYERTIRLE